jgi:hypothetical protein
VEERTGTGRNNRKWKKEKGSGRKKMNRKIEQ